METLFPLTEVGPLVTERPDGEVTAIEFGCSPARTSNLSLNVRVTFAGIAVRIEPLLGSEETRVECASAIGVEAMKSGIESASTRSLFMGSS